MLFSLSAFAQQESVKIYKTKRIGSTASEMEPAESQTAAKSSFSTSSKGAGGTVNGSTSDNLSVSLSGGVNYSVPIDVPPGLNGIQPEIALTFDSHAGNGLAGWGWNISGVSVITRIPATYFHENLVDGVDFDSYDRFALDGQRLIVKNGTYGGSGAVYQTEQYSNLKIISYGSHPDSGIDGPAYFKVFYPDGSIGYYGNSSGSRTQTDYAITYWENPQGIRISYNYNKINNALSIDKITYGSRGTTTPINEIQFEYFTSRYRDEHSYINGIKYQREEKLQRIVIPGYRTYSLTYNQTSSLNYDRLISIQESSQVTNNVYRNDIDFTYGETTVSTPSSVTDNANSLSLSNIDQETARTVSFDANGNGKMDFLVYPTTGPDTKKKFWLFSDEVGNPGSYEYAGNGYDTGTFVDIFPANVMNDQYRLFAEQGLVVIQNSGSTQVRFEMWGPPDPASGVQIGNIYTKTWNAPTYNTETSCDLGSYNYRIPQKYLSGDFDGDGLSDVLAIGLPYSYNHCDLIIPPPGENCNGGGTPQAIANNPGLNQSSQVSSSENIGSGNPQPSTLPGTCCECENYNFNSSEVTLIKLDRRISSNFATSIGFLASGYDYSDRYHTMDVNGDGKTDILRFLDGKVEVYTLNTNNSFVLLWQTTDTDIDLDFPVMPGDYNGDGNMDFMIPRGNNSSSFAVFMSEGNGYDKNNITYPFEFKYSDIAGSTNYGYNLIPVDINGDNKTDILDYQTVTYDSNSNGTQMLAVYANRDSGTSSGLTLRFTKTGGTTSVSGNLKGLPIPLFLNSDQPNNNLDFASISDKYIRTFSFSKDHREDVTLKSIDNNGVVTNIKYDQVNPFYDNTPTDPSFFKAYQSANSYLSQVYPFVNVNVSPSFKVVRELVQTGSGHTRTQRYYYEGAVSHATGLGFMGFEVMKRSNWYGTDVPAVWTLSKYNPMLRGAITEQIVSTSTGNNPPSYKSKVNYFYDYQLIANQGSALAPQYPENITRNTAMSSGLTDEAEVSITLSDGFHAGGSHSDYHGYIFPIEEQPGDVGYAGAVDIILERMETDNGLTGVFSTETYTYDQYNNPLVTTTSFPGGSRVETRQYYNNAGATNNTYHVGRLKNIKETVTLNGNSFSTEEQYKYNNNLVTEIKKKGNSTGWLTESFGHDLNGNITSRSLTDGANITRSESFVYSPTYGERFLTESTDIEDLVTTFVYESHTGNLSSTTDPLGWTTSYTYDNWGRVTKETDYLSNDTDHTYSNLSGGELEHTTNYPDGGQEMTRYNAFGWVTRSGTLSLNNQWVYTDMEYYLDGKIKRESQPHNGSAGQWNTYNYDQYNQPTTQQLYTGRTITYTHTTGSLSTTVNDGVKTVTTTLDALGNTVKVVDPGGTVDYTYFANGTLKTADYGGNVVTVGIDGWGRKISLSDPSAGSYSYTYNDVGELLTETTPKGTTTYEYDKPTGRLTSKEIKGDQTDLLLDYEYNDPDAKRLTKITGNDFTGSGRTYIYDYSYESGGLKRLKSIEENTGLANFEYIIDYDPNYGKVEYETLISSIGGVSKSVKTKNVYDTSGLLKEIWNDSGTPQKLWELNDITPRGQALKITLGNGIEKIKTYDSYGYVTKIEDKEAGTMPNPTVALHMEYDFNAQRGTLNSRENFGFNWDETFAYDNLDRLTDITGDVTHSMTYANNGNITNNDALGDYMYGDSGKKYRLTEIDPNTPGETYFQQHPTQQITYNAFKKPVDIHEAGHGRVSFEYGPLMNRSTAYYGGEQADKTQRRYKKHYSAIIPVEIVEDTQAGTTKILTYVGGDAYSAPIVHIKTTGTGAIDEYHYLHRDYLGSILAITDADGDVKEERQFGAWGVVDKFLDDASGTAFTHASLLGRGYTGHEHFFEVSLIHMNGRMYDPQQGRFLSPDNFIQEPFNTQSYNRYGYVLNNPLMYTDPSGEFFFGGAEIGLAFKIIGWVAGTFAAVGLADAIFDLGIFQGADVGYNSSYANPAPTPGINKPNTQMTSSVSNESRPSRGGPGDNSPLLDTWNKLNNFRIGARDGFFAGAISSWDFVQSLGTAQGWKGLGQGFVSLAELGDPMSANGQLMRVHIFQSAEKKISELPQMSAYEIGYDTGYVGEKVVESVLLSKGAGVVSNITKVSGGIFRIRSLGRGLQVSTWNQFQRATAGQFASRAEASAAWTAYKSKNGIVSGVLRSQSQKMTFLKQAADSKLYPKWMNQWLRQGKVPPGYQVDHIIPLSVGGKDIPANMRLIDIDFHKLHHKYYRPWE